MNATAVNLTSIIIPIYNVEQYLPTCIESAIGQTYSNLEILLIDDGSTDNSGKICDEYAAKDSRIKVIHKQNAGVSEARNSGIDAARGEFTFHLDGDDSLPLDAIETLMAKQKEGDHDLVFGDFTRIFEDSSKYISKNYNYDKYTLLKRIVGDLGFPHYLAGNLIRRDLHVKHNIKAKKGIDAGEDFQVFTQLVYFAKSFAKVDKSVYNYTCRQNSMSNDVSLDRMKHDIASIGIVADFLKQHGETELHENLLATKIRMMPEWLYLLCQKKRYAEYRELLSIANNPELKPLRKYLPTPHKILLCIPSPQMANLYFKMLKVLA